MRWKTAPPKPKPGVLKWKCKEEAVGETTGPQAYYELAVPASSWIQYEAARSLESHVGFTTNSPESFGHLTSALGQHRAGKIGAAKASYEEALSDDPENVAALVNLGLLEARQEGKYGASIERLKQARTALRKRYEVAQ